MYPHLQYRIALICLFLFLSGCADTPKVFRFDNANQATKKVWPEGTEKPRYGYIGELTGENNFRSENPENRSSTTKILEWLTGLTERKPDPIVLRRPQCGTVDDEGRIFVTDISRAAVYVFDKPAGRLEIWDKAKKDVPFLTPIGIAQGPQGQILVVDADMHSVFRLDSKGNPIGEFGHDVLKRPTGLARDPQRGQIYVADTRAHDIKVFSDDGNLLKIFGQRGEGTGEFNAPTYLTFSADKLYVTDTLNSRIQVFDLEGKVVKKFGKRGLHVGNLVRPKGVAVDSESNIYVIESLYDNLLVFDNQGRTLLALGGTGKETGEFYLPSGVWTDSHDQIYISDMFNGRVTVLQFFGGAQ